MGKFTDIKVNLKESVMDHIRAVSLKTEDKWEDISLKHLLGFPSTAR